VQVLLGSLDVFLSRTGRRRFATGKERLGTMKSAEKTFDLNLGKSCLFFFIRFPFFQFASCLLLSVPCPFGLCFLRERKKKEMKKECTCVWKAAKGIHCILQQVKQKKKKRVEESM
jgi:hypothetical protein